MNIFSLTYRNGIFSESFPNYDSENTLVLIFGDQSYFNDHKPFKAINQAFPLAVKVGCSTAGEIYADQVVDNSLSIAIVKFAYSNITAVYEKISTAEDSFKVGEQIAENCLKEDLRGIFVLSDGLQVNGSELVKGIGQRVGHGPIITGGLAGDGSRFEHTWVLNSNGYPEASMVTGVAFYGERIEIAHGSQGGWDFFGPERMVTKSKGNIVYEIDDQPALTLYKKYLGDKSEELPASALLFPLQVRTKKDGRPIVRTVLSVNEEEQSMTFAGDVKEGSFAQLMRANFDRLIDGAVRAATELGSGLPQLAIAISCVGRRLVLGERIEEEVEATLVHMGADETTQVGFYSYGEISPYIKGEPCELHNQTMTLTTFREV